MQGVLPLVDDMFLQLGNLHPRLSLRLLPFDFRESWRWKRASFF